MYLASQYGNKNAVDCLVEKRADYTIPDNVSKWLLLIIESNNHSLCINCNSYNEGTTPSHYLCQYNVLCYVASTSVWLLTCLEEAVLYNHSYP